MLNTCRTPFYLACWMINGFLCCFICQVSCVGMNINKGLILMFSISIYRRLMYSFYRSYTVKCISCRYSGSVWVVSLSEFLHVYISWEPYPGSITTENELFETSKYSINAMLCSGIVRVTKTKIVDVGFWHLQDVI